LEKVSQMIDFSNAQHEITNIKDQKIAIAQKNVEVNKDLVPDNYGLAGFPSEYNMGAFSTLSLMNVMDTTAAERSFNSLKSLTPGPFNSFWLGDMGVGPKLAADPDNPCQ
jgi:hypothetical protein